jgi:hypothetical protein
LRVAGTVPASFRMRRAARSVGRWSRSPLMATSRVDASMVDRSSSRTPRAFGSDAMPPASGKDQLRLREIVRLGVRGQVQGDGCAGQWPR